MALRSEAHHRRCVMLLLAFLAASAALQAVEFPVTHVHLRRDEPGRLQIEPDGIQYTETKSHKKPHEYRWAWTDIQKLVLEPERLEIVTYKDVKWLAGLDKKFEFRGEGLEAAYPLLNKSLPRRLIPEIAVVAGLGLSVEVPAKRLEGRSGQEGLLRIGLEKIVFESSGKDGSHTWVLGEVENISSSDPLELTIASLGTDYRLQLKQPLPEGVYDGLWRKLNIKRSH